MIIIFILSFQGPTGGLTFPLNGVSIHWFERLWAGRRRRRHLGGVRALARARRASSWCSPWCCRCVAGLAFRKRFSGSDILFYRRGREPHRALDRDLARHRARVPPARRFRQEPRAGMAGRGPEDDAMGTFTSGLGAQLTWTLPFGLLIMFAIFNRFDAPLRGGRARPRRDAVAELRPRQSCRSSLPERHRHRAVRLHPVLGRGRALQPGDGRAQHPADRACRR